MIGAAISTSISIIIGDIILMNVYYYKVLKLDIFRMFKEIQQGTLVVLIITATVSHFVTRTFDYTLINFVYKTALFLVLYGCLLALLSLNKHERKMFLLPLKNVLHKIR